MKKKVFLPVLALLGGLALTGCQNNSSQQAPSSSNPTSTQPSTSPSTSSPSSPSSPSTPSSPSSPSSPSTPTPDPEPEPVVTTNFRREGNLTLDVQLPMLLNILGIPNITYDSTTDLYFQNVSDGSLGRNLEWNIYPNVIDDTSEDSAYSVESNFAALAFVYGFPQSLGSIGEMIGELPSLPYDMQTAAPAYKANSTASEENPATTETLSVNLVDGQDAVFTGTSSDGTKTGLRTYIESDVSSLYESIASFDIEETIEGLGDTLNGLDLSGLDVVSALQLIDILFDSMIPDSSSLRPIITTIGEVIAFLGEGLDIDIVADSQGASSIDVVLSLNQDGLDELTNIVSGLIDDAVSGILPGFSIDPSVEEVRLSLNFFNEGETLKNQFGGIELNLGLSIMSMPMSVDLDLAFDHTATQVENDYFEDRNAVLAEYSAIDAAFEAYYGKVDPYLNDASRIDLRAATEETVDALVAEYEGLSEDVRFMLGSTVSATSIPALYEAGRDALLSLSENWKALEEKSFAALSDIDSFVSSVKGYAYWKEAIGELSEGEAIVSAIDATVSSVLSKAESDAEVYLADVEAYKADPSDVNEGKIVADLKAFSSLVDNVDPEGQYAYLFSSEQLETGKAIVTSLSNYEEVVLDAYLDHLFSVFGQEGFSLTYDVLVEEFASVDCFYKMIPSSSRGVLEERLAARLAADTKVDSLIEEAIEAKVASVQKTLLDTYRTNPTKEAWEPVYNQALEDIRTINGILNAMDKKTDSFTGDVTTLLFALDDTF